MVNLNTSKYKNISEDEIILTEQDIINTYDERQQEQCRLYLEYLKIKEENPNFGYKRIAKLLGQKYGKTRWWHAGKHIPVPIQTVNWLKQKELLPLTFSNPKLDVIARILGSTFGDGGIFQNLNAIFLSSSEMEALDEFAKDFTYLFGEQIQENSRIQESGEYGQSWHYDNTNRNVIRLFKALGAPIGRKGEIELNIPRWIFKHIEIADEFFGALIGNEIGIPKVHINKNSLDTLSLGICASPLFKENRHNFLNGLREYLTNKDIKSGKISECLSNKDENLVIYRLLLSVEFENVLNFLTLTKIRYCNYKQKKLINTINEFGAIKKQRYTELISQGYSQSTALSKIRINEAMLYVIENELPIPENFSEQNTQPIFNGGAQNDKLKFMDIR